jgi:hypothetical protein
MISTLARLRIYVERLRGDGSGADTAVLREMPCLASLSLFLLSVKWEQ